VFDLLAQFAYLDHAHHVAACRVRAHRSEVRDLESDPDPIRRWPEMATAETDVTKPAGVGFDSANGIEP
jgi:hypothetical protein